MPETRSQDHTNHNFGLNKQEFDAIEVLGFELYQQGKTAEAEVIFRGLIAIDERLYRGFAGMGALALAELKFDEAAKWLEAARERNANDPTVRANLGETLFRMGQFERAAAEFEGAFRLDPQHKDPGANRARALLAGLTAMTEEMQRRQMADEDSASEYSARPHATSGNRNR